MTSASISGMATDHADAMSAWSGPFWREAAFAMAQGMRSPAGEEGRGEVVVLRGFSFAVPEKRVPQL